MKLTATVTYGFRSAGLFFQILKGITVVRDFYGLDALTVIQPTYCHPKHWRKIKN